MTTPAPLAPTDLFAEVSHIITSSHNADETLSRIVRMIAEQTQVDVCSIYGYVSKEDLLVLKATHGLNQETVGQVRMHSSEGLVGLVLEQMQPVHVAQMQSHLRFKPFPQTNEDSFSSLLGVPLIEHRQPFGVLVVHTIESRDFSEDEISVLTTIASQISSLVSKTLLIQQLDKTAVHTAVPVQRGSQRISGNSVASGVATGRAAVMQQTTLEEPTRLSERTPEDELADLQAALDHVTEDTLKLVDKISGYVGPDEAAIFHVHLMFLEDHTFQEKIQQHIEEGATVAWAIYETIEEYLIAFEEIDDPYLREKGTDLKDVGYRLLNYLGHGRSVVTEKAGILVARQLLPGDIARLNPDCIQGILTSSGGVVSHTAILARSLLVPAVCISEDELATIHEGDEIALDGDVGLVVLHPSEEVLGEFSRRLEQERLYRKHLESYRELPCQTQDGERIGIYANVAMEGDVLQLEHYGAEGVGLYRTEIYFLSLDRYPQVEEQEKTYSRILSRVPKDQRMIFRTLDIGADKAAPYMGFQQEENPFLGFRALRRQLRQPEVLKKQIKALFLAARTHDNVQLLFPMVMELDEFRKAKKLVEKCRNELELQGLDVPKLPVGAMFEVPAAVMLCDHFMPELDFCSIGSNDLTQYVLAVDRNNPQTSNLYDPLHPSVLQLIRRLADSAKRHDKPLELCGEMASDPDGCVVLVGLGIRLLSMNPPLIPVVKERLSQVTLEQAQKIAKRALEMHSAGEVRRHIRRTIGTARKLPA